MANFLSSLTTMDYDPDTRLGASPKSGWLRPKVTGYPYKWLGPPTNDWLSPQMTGYAIDWTMHDIHRYLDGQLARGVSHHSGCGKSERNGGVLTWSGQLTQPILYLVRYKVTPSLLSCPLMSETRKKVTLINHIELVLFHSSQPLNFSFLCSMTASPLFALTVLKA